MIESARHLGPPSQMVGISLRNGIQVRIDPAWIIEGEDRLSYVSLMRLVEWCREFHWARDIRPVCPRVDSVVRSMDVKFHRPVLAGSLVDVTYSVASVRSRLYSLVFCIHLHEPDTLLAEVKMACCFYDPIARCSLPGPGTLVHVLATLQETSGE